MISNKTPFMGKYGIMLVILTICTYSCKEVEVEPQKTVPTDNAYINVQHSGVDARLTSVHFFDTENGITVGDENYLSTDNGGTTWSKVEAISNPNEDDVVDTTVTYSKIIALQEITFLVGALHAEGDVYSNVLYKSLDDGKTWGFVSENLPTIDEVFSTVAFYDESIGLLANADGEIHKTVDGGVTWTLVQDGIELLSHRGANMGLIDIQFSTDGSTAIGVGPQGGVYVSMDAGSTWKLDEGAPYARAFKRVKFFNETEGYIIGGKETYPNEDKAMVFKFKVKPDGTLEYENRTDVYYAVFFYDDIHITDNGETLWLCGDLGQVFAPFDGGKSWSSELTQSQRESDLHSLSFPTDEVGYFVGADGIILKVELE